MRSGVAGATRRLWDRWGSGPPWVLTRGHGHHCHACHRYRPSPSPELCRSRLRASQWDEETASCLSPVERLERSCYRWAEGKGTSPIPSRVDCGCCPGSRSAARRSPRHSVPSSWAMAGCPGRGVGSPDWKRLPPSDLPPLVRQPSKSAKPGPLCCDCVSPGSRCRWWSRDPPRLDFGSPRSAAIAFHCLCAGARPRSSATLLPTTAAAPAARCPASTD